MTCRALSAGLALLLLAGLTTAGRADDPLPTPARTADAAALEKRLVDLEKQLAALMKEVQSIRKDLKAQAPHVEIKIFALKHAEAAHVAHLLQDLLGGKVGKTIRIVADQRTNSLVIHATPEHLRLVEALLTRLDEPAAERKALPPPAKKAREQPRQPPAELRARIAELESDLEMRQDRAAWAARMVKKGFMTVGQAQADQAAARAAAAALERAQREIRDYLGKSSDKARKPGD